MCGFFESLFARRRSAIAKAHFPQLREYCPRAFGTWAIFPELREISLTIDLDASHYLHTAAACSGSVSPLY